MSSIPAGPGIPAWAQKMSRPPSFVAASSALARTASMQERSATTVSITMPSRAMSAASAASASPSTSMAQTRAPSAANRRTPARPMPDAAAVITASLLLSLILAPLPHILIQRGD